MRRLVAGRPRGWGGWAASVRDTTGCLEFVWKCVFSGLENPTVSGGFEGSFFVRRWFVVAEVLSVGGFILDEKVGCEERQGREETAGESVERVKVRPGRAYFH